MEELSLKHRTFIDEYFSNGLKARSAYEVVYPRCKKGHTSKKGSELLKKLEKSAYFVQKSAEKCKKSEDSYRENIKRLELIFKLASEGDDVIDPRTGQIIGKKRQLSAAVQAVNEINKMEGNHAETKLKLSGSVDTNVSRKHEIKVSFSDFTKP